MMDTSCQYDKYSTYTKQKYIWKMSINTKNFYLNEKCPKMFKKLYGECRDPYN